MVIMMSKESKIAYSIFSWLREKLPNADICTLRHISVYLARTNDEFDVEKDLKLILSTDKSMCNLLLSDGSEIRFENNSNKTLNFIVDKHDLDVYMTLLVSTKEVNNLSTAMVLGDVRSGDWSYIIGSNDYESGVCFLKVYYKNELVENGTSYFQALSNNDIALDCIDNLGHLTDIMIKLDLLYDNVRSIKKNRLVRKKCV